MAKKTLLMDSVLDLNSTNIWSIDEYQLSALWEQTKQEEDFASSEDKLLNVIRQAFEVVHYNPDDVRDIKKYENGEWALMSHCKPGKGSIALRKKVIKNLSDLTFENVKHITVATLLELIDRNFGGGWDSISSTTKDIINSAFEISTTQLPASRIHAPGGTLELKVSLGFEVLEITKGTWVEAIFAKKKEPVEKVHFKPESKPFDSDEDGDLDEDAMSSDKSEYSNDDEEEDISENDDTFYSSYAPEAEIKDEEEEGFGMEEVSEL